MQDRLGLVVGVMREEHARQAVLGDHLPKKREARDAETRGDVWLEVGERRFDFAARRDRTGEAETRGDVAHEPRIFRTRAVARLVIQMNDVEGEVGTKPGQQEQQGNAIRPAADGDGPAAGWHGPDRDFGIRAERSHYSARTKLMTTASRISATKTDAMITSRLRSAVGAGARLAPA